jgi:hypothetical protein
MTQIVCKFVVVWIDAVGGINRYFGLALEPAKDRGDAGLRNNE